MSKCIVGQETKPQLVVFSQSMSESVRKLTKKYVSNDCATFNTIETAKESKGAKDDDEKEEEDEDDEVKI